MDLDLKIDETGDATRITTYSERAQAFFLKSLGADHWRLSTHEWMFAPGCKDKLLEALPSEFRVWQ